MDFLEKRITAQKKEEEGRRFLLVYIYILRSVTLSFFLVTKYTYMRAREFIDISFFFRTGATVSLDERRTKIFQNR